MTTMKKFKKIYQTVCLTGLLALSTSSCTDWLTIYPQDRVVEENFWEDKNDLEGVRYGAYRQMARTISKLALWGDLRADSYEENGAITEDKDLHNKYIDVWNGMPDSSMDFFDWGGVYTTINYCNKVLQHGAEVLARDKQFTTGEWIQMKAEVTALRALNYFYLIRAFKDVPYTTKVINKDSEVENFPQTNQLVILDSIINDCEQVKGKARSRFSNKGDSKGLITNSAIYAMLADMYLWRGALHEGRFNKTHTDIVNGVEVSHNVNTDYQRAIECADTSLLYLNNQNEEEKESSGLNSSAEETINYGLQYCNMIKNNFEGVSQATVPKLEALSSIFRKRNSRESIFELQYSNTDNIKNDIVNSLFGFSNSTHMAVNKDALDNLYDGGITGTEDNGGMWDSRLWICCQNKLVTGSNNSNVQAQAKYYCMKYHMPSSDFLNMEGSTSNREIKSLRYTSSSYNNWIVYRMTDVMLMKAEALACIGDTKSAENICNAIHRRSYCNFRNPSKVPSTDLSSTVTIGNTIANKVDVEINKATNTSVTIKKEIMCVMNERQIELLGEGKRWFDLVRFAERNSYEKVDSEGNNEDPREAGVSNGQKGINVMVKLFLGTGSNANFATTLINRFKNRYGLYCPIYELEVKASGGAIEQNPVWNKSKYEQ